MLSYLSAVEPVVTAEERYASIKDEQIVMLVPSGGIIVNHDGGSEFSQDEINKNAGKLMSFKDYKEYEKNHKFSLLTGKELFDSYASPFRAASPYGLELITLANNRDYLSQEFSEPGWRFSGARFRPAAGTGAYLRWTSKGDSGRVGSLEEARSTYHGTLAGTTLEQDSPKYVFTQASGSVYYTFNPNRGARYFVENR